MNWTCSRTGRNATNTSSAWARSFQSWTKPTKTEDSLIKGCQSRVWLYTEPDKGVLKLYADSDSLITKGLIAVFIRLLSGLPPEEILKADMSKLDRTRPEGPSGAHQGERPQLHGRPDQAGRHEHGGTPLIFPVR